MNARGLTLQVLSAMAVAFVFTATGDTAELDLHHADFHARLGMKVAVQVGKVGPEVSLKGNLTSDKGLSRTVADKGGRLGEEETIVLNLRDLPAATYTLTVGLSDGRQAVRTWKKPYDGMPKAGIDENNAVCLEGRLFFPVMCKGINSEADIEKWKPYVNTLKHIGFDPKLYTPEGFKLWLDRAQKAGLRAIGPGRGYYWPNGGGIYKSDTQRDRKAIAEKQQLYIEVARRHPAFMMYEWKDEPDLDHRDNCIFPEEVRRWADQCHEADPEHLVFCTFSGTGYARPEGNFKHEQMKEFSYLFAGFPDGRKRMMTDVLSVDYYPLEDAGGKYDVSIENMCLAMDRMRAWNADLAPMIACVETCDIKDPKTPAPTPQELRLLVWANIVHGAKGISWFHYFNPTPKENFAEMARFKDQVTRLTPAVLGPDYQSEVTDREFKGGRVDVMAKRHGDAVYLFAVNIKRAAEAVAFTVPGATPGATVEVFDEQRTLKVAGGGTFQDDFDPLGVHIYVVPLGGK